MSIQIFLAHANEDKAVVIKIYEQLQQEGYKPWLDKIDLIPGQNWRDEIPKVINSCQIFIACLSQHSVSKNGYVQREFRMALNAYANRPLGANYLIPLRLDNCVIPDFRQQECGINLRDIHWLDYWLPDGFEQLVRAIEYQCEKCEMPDGTHLFSKNSDFFSAREESPEEINSVTKQNKPRKKRLLRLGFQPTLSDLLSRQSNFSEEDLTSDRFGVNYYKELQRLLKKGAWKEADQETADRMLEVIHGKAAGWLERKHFERFPCKDLRNIDNLWMKYSKQKFGFSRHRKIWQDCGVNSKERSDEALRKWIQFGNQLGLWDVNETWTNLSEVHRQIGPVNYHDLFKTSNLKSQFPLEIYIPFRRWVFRQQNRTNLKTILFMRDKLNFLPLFSRISACSIR